MRPNVDLRWRLLDDLTQARDHYDLKDRSLQVLRALLSFLPRGERVDLIVFPSNRTLADRLLGMPESTLRRHIALLCDRGLIARRDSPNRKRFRVGRCADLTFGLDLAPFFAAARKLRDRAIAAAEDRQRRRDLRARILDRLTRIAPEATLQNETRRALRRKLTVAALTDLLAAVDTFAAAGEMSTGDSENERHLQPQSRDSNSDTIETALHEVAAVTGRTIVDARSLEEAGRTAGLALSAVPGWQFATNRMGAAWAVLALAYLHRRAGEVRNPNGYLSEITRRAADGRFDLIAALARTPAKVDCSQLLNSAPYGYPYHRHGAGG